MRGFTNGMPMIGQPVSGPAPVSVAAPMNDVQLLAMLAGLFSAQLPVKEAVERSGAIVAEVIRQMPNFQVKVREATM